MKKLSVTMLLSAFWSATRIQPIFSFVTQKSAVLALSRRSASIAPLTFGTPATTFDDGKSPLQITTPIYYVNDKPHIGHAYTSTGEFNAES
jgi:hypothetical protein